MSEPIPGICCKECNDFLPWQEVQSNENGNQGRFFAVCPKLLPGTNKKHYYRWRTASPSTSPALGSTSQLPGGRGPVTPPATQAPHARRAQSPRSRRASPSPRSLGKARKGVARRGKQGGCRVQSCPRSRVNKNCKNATCATHCRLQGGCELPDHQAEGLSTAVPPHRSDPIAPPRSRSPPIGAAPPEESAEVVQPSASTSASSTLTPQTPQQVLASTSTSVLSTSTAQAPRAPLNPLPNPRFASQINPIFTNQMRVEEERRKTKQDHDAKRLQSIQRIKQNVTVYAWNMDDTEPAVVEFQEGYIWPNFNISAAVLHELEMFTGNDNVQERFHLWRPSLGIWTKVRSHHCIQVDEQKHVFIKAISVTRCPGFDTLIKTSMRVTPHFRLNLPQERASVKSSLDDHLVAHAPLPRMKKLSLKRPRSPPSPAHPPRRRPPPPRPLLTPLASRFTASPSPSFERSLGVTRSMTPTIKLEPGLEIMGSNERSGSVISLHDTDSDPELRLSTKTRPDPIYISDTSPTPPRILVKSEMKPFSIAHRSSDATPPPGIMLSHRRDNGHLPHHREKGKKRATTADLEDGPSSMVDGREKEWLADFYVCDVVDGFQKCQKPPRGSTVAIVFEDYFGIKWKKSTYYDNKKHWKLADSIAKVTAYDAGRVRAALWSRFSADNPTKDVELKAARKRIRSLKARTEKGRQGSCESTVNGDESSEDTSSGDEGSLTDSLMDT